MGPLLRCSLEELRRGLLLVYWPIGAPVEDIADDIISLQTPDFEDGVDLHYPEGELPGGIDGLCIRGDPAGEYDGSNPG